MVEETMKSQKIFGIIGWKNAGKTTLVVKLVEYFTARGLKVATVKHAHHDFDIDHPGKDSFLHREAGAGQVVIASDRRIAMVIENETPAAPTLEDILRFVEPCDLVLVEGFKWHPHAKLEVIRGSSEHEPIAFTDPSVLAIACDQKIDIGSRPMFDPEDVDSIAQFILRTTKLSLPPSAVHSNL